MYEKQISQIEDVKDFFQYLANSGLCFHPDDDAGDIGNQADGQWKNTFTKAEAKLYNSLMIDCFTVCHAADVDIYELMLTISDSVQ